MFRYLALLLCLGGSLAAAQPRLSDLNPTDTVTFSPINKRYLCVGIKNQGDDAVTLVPCMPNELTQQYQLEYIETFRKYFIKNVGTGNCLYPLYKPSSQQVVAALGTCPSAAIFESHANPGIQWSLSDWTGRVEAAAKFPGDNGKERCWSDNAGSLSLGLCSTSSFQEFTITKLEGAGSSGTSVKGPISSVSPESTWIIQPESSSSLCLDINDYAMVNVPTIEPCGPNSKGQAFSLVPAGDGYFLLKAQSSRMFGPCLYMDAVAGPQGFIQFLRRGQCPEDSTGHLADLFKWKLTDWTTPIQNKYNMGEMMCITNVANIAKCATADPAQKFAISSA